VVIRGLRLLLFVVAVAVMTCAAGQAQDGVSLVGLSAERANGRAVIELHISGSADFQVNRFTTGDWISVWSDSFEISDNVSEIPLALDRPDLADLVSGASLVNEQRKSTIRLYLGPEADRRGVCITEDGNTVKVYVPESVPDVPAAPEIEMTPAEPAGLPFTAADEGIDEVEPLADTAEVVGGSVGDGAPVDVGSFYVPRDSSPQPVVAPAPKPVVTPAPKPVATPEIDAEVSVTPRRAQVPSLSRRSILNSAVRLPSRSRGRPSRKQGSLPLKTQPPRPR